jgi:iron(III) transport system ATP-binding protein
MSRALIAENLTKRFAGRAVVDGVSLDLQPGTVTALVGGSGAGKTTLLRLFAGMERPDQGAIRVGEDVLSSTKGVVAPEDRGVGLIFQDFALFPNMTVMKNITFGLHKLPRNERETRARAWLSRLNLEHRKDAFPHQLSGGEQQRVAIARALAPQPVAVLMDEPFSGLDPSLRRQARDAAMSALTEAGTPTLVVTHDAEEAFGLADRIAVMQAGRLLQCDTPEGVYERPVSIEVAEALGPLQQVSRASLPEAWRNGVSGNNVWLRPEAVMLDPDSQVEAQVVGLRLAGPHYDVELAFGEVRLRATLPAQVKAQIGDIVRVSLNTARIYCFGDHAV